MVKTPQGFDTIFIHLTMECRVAGRNLRPATEYILSQKTGSIPFVFVLVFMGNLTGGRKLRPD